MSRRPRGLCECMLAGALLLVPSAVAATPAPETSSTASILQRVDHYYNALHSLRVDFTEHYDGMGLHREDAGTLLLKKPGRMRWIYTRPAGKQFVLDGHYAWFYSDGDAQVQRVPASQLDDLRSPLRFLLGHTQLEKELVQPTVSPLPDGGTSITGVPRGMEQRIAHLTVQVAPDGAIRAMTLEELDGATTRFTFSHPQPNVPVTDADFAFRPPPGVPVVDGLPPV